MSLYSQTNRSRQPANGMMRKVICITVDRTVDALARQTGGLTGGQPLHRIIKRDVLERALEGLKVCKHTREMIMVAAASFMFARTCLRIGLASTPTRSFVELFCS